MEVGPLVGTGFRGRSGCPHRSAALRPGLTLRGALPGWKAECRPLWSPARAGPTVLGTPPAVSIPPPPHLSLGSAFSAKSHTRGREAAVHLLPLLWEVLAKQGLSHLSPETYSSHCVWRG